MPHNRNTRNPSLALTHAELMRERREHGLGPYRAQKPLRVSVLQMGAPKCELCGSVVKGADPADQVLCKRCGADRECAWEGCHVSLAGQHRARKWCDKHAAEVKRAQQRERKRAQAARKAA